MTTYSVEKEYEVMVDAYEKAGGDRSALLNKDVAKLVVHENRVLSADGVPGVRLRYEPKENGIMAELLVEEGIKVKHSVHLCFGINYGETHYHGDFGGIEVIPKAKITLGEKALYENTFSLVEGCVGKLDFDYEVFSGARSVAELVAKVYGKKDDIIKIAERVNLDADGARSLIKTRVVLTDRATAEVIGETYGNAPYARGHVDCIELVNGQQAVAKAIPIVVVTNEKAKVTHEAAIGSIDRRQIETLMARGLDENEAVDVIVRGILR